MTETPTAPVSGNRIHYFDTASLLDLNEFGLIDSLRMVDVVVVEEVLGEIHNSVLVDKLKTITSDRGPRRRAHVPGVGNLDHGEIAAIRAMFADERECVYVSNDGKSVEFIRSRSAEGIYTSDFVIWLHSRGYITDDDVKRILNNDSRHPTRECRRRLTNRLE
jgi:hypothetical protein